MHTVPSGTELWGYVQVEMAVLGSLSLTVYVDVSSTVPEPCGPRDPGISPHPKRQKCSHARLRFDHHGSPRVRYSSLVWMYLSMGPRSGLPHMPTSKPPRAENPELFKGNGQFFIKIFFYSLVPIGCRHHSPMWWEPRAVQRQWSIPSF